MTHYIALCFYCQKSLKLREAIIVKEALSRTILHKYHPECYAKLTEPVARQRAEWEQLKQEMRDAQIQARSSTPVPEQASPARS